METPDSIRTIGPKRQWIFEQHDADLFGPYAVILDDDLCFSVRRTDEPAKFTAMREDHEFDEMMAQLLDLFAAAPLVGIRNRGGANRDLAPALAARRQHDVIGVDVGFMRRHGFRLDRATLMEDFDFVLQYLTAGYPNLLLNTFVEDDGGGRDNSGGCADERTLQKQHDASVWLAEQWPDFVKVVQKETRGSGDWAVRTDVRVQWAKALQYGRSQR